MERWSLVIGVAMALAGCAFNPGSSTRSPITRAHLGGAIVLKHSVSEAVNVTAVKVIDPVVVLSNPEPLDGNRFVGVTLTITNTGTSILNGDADTSTDVIGSDNLPYDPELEPLAGCKNFHDGMFALQPAESAPGCVAFQLPSEVAVSKVQFELSTGRTSAEWSVL